MPRQRKILMVEDMAAAKSMPVAEVYLLTTGQYAGQFECKYSYSADLGDERRKVWGWSSTMQYDYLRLEATGTRLALP